MRFAEPGNNLSSFIARLLVRTTAVNVRFLYLAVSLAGCALLTPGAGPAPAGDKPKGPVWLTDYALALKAAKESGKPIFAVFR